VSVAELLEELRRQGLELWFEGERLRFRAPEGVFTSERRSALLACRDDMLAQLRGEARARKETYPLSSNQTALWFINQENPGSAAYNVAFAARVVSTLNLAALRHALQALIDRHPALRTTFLVEDISPMQHVAGALPVAFAVHEVPDVDEPALRQLVEVDYRRPFDLGSGPVFRASLYSRTPADHVLLLVAHHMVVDGWSLLQLIEEVRSLYAEGTGKTGVSVPRPNAKYSDFVNWQARLLESPEGEELGAYWERQLAEPRAQFELASDLLPVGDTPPCGRTRSFALDPDLSLGVRQLARDRGVTTFIVLLAAFKVLLRRHTGASDIIVGTPMFGRNRPEFARVIGDFVNTVPLRSMLEADRPFSAFAEELRRTVLEAINAQDYPLLQVVERVRPPRDPGRSPLFQTLFILQRFDQIRGLEPVLIGGPSPQTVNFGGMKLQHYALDQQDGQFDLTLQVVDCNETMFVQWKYDASRFESATIARLHAHYERILAAVIADPAVRLAEIPLITPAEERVMRGRNETDARHDRTHCVSQLFEAVAAASPDAPAVVAGLTRLTYRELDRRACQLAYLLHARSVRAGDLVAVCLDRTVEVPIALVAVLKAGAAYVPLDPTHPTDRLRCILSDSGASCIITLRRFLPLFQGSEATLVVLDDAERELAEQPDVPLEVQVSPDDLAYVIYTSGSTGRPKGVEIEHRSLTNFLHSMRREPGLARENTVLSITTLSFDIAGLEIWLPLTTGARVVIASGEDVQDADRLVGLMQRHDASLLQATPATWRLLLAAGWRGKRNLKALCGGEALPRDLAQALLERVGELWNMYGPTETTVWSTLCKVEDLSRGVMIGRPIANTRVYVFEPSGLPAPIGVAGELCIAGDGVARGYRNRPELTADRFVTVTLPDGRRERVYRTGDMARFRNDGQLEFLGRRDHQVKVRGYRIELEEIEAVLATHAGVKECVVVARGSAEDQRLVGYVVLSEGASFDADAARETLRARVPEYMVPNLFMVLPALPLTPNRKIDRNALPAPQPATAAASRFDAVMTPAQGRVAALWRSVLGVERVGLYDNFFDLGGHSLLLMKLHVQLKREFETQFPLVELFQRTTVAAQAGLFSAAKSADVIMKRARARAMRQVHG
jgi:amino acid adenylation domain-containing protein